MQFVLCIVVRRPAGPYNTRQDVTILENEPTNAKNLQGIQRQDKDKVTVVRVAPISLLTKADRDDAEMQAIDRDLNVAQVKLRDTLSANDLLNRRIWKAQDVLLSVYEKASVHLEEVLLICVQKKL